MRVNLPVSTQEYVFPKGETLVSTTDLKGRILYCNPMYPMLGSLNYAVIEGRTPPAGLLLASFAWAMATIVAGTLFFISREREFAIRI